MLALKYVMKVLLKLEKHAKSIKFFYFINENYNKSLKAINISSCPELTTRGAYEFIKIKPNLTKFWAANNTECITGIKTKHL